MLVSFSVKNFRSFASNQTISMSSGGSSTSKNNFSFPSGNSLAPQLLRSSCLFGSNGAGKSSLIMAMDFYREFIVSSAKDTQEGEDINVSSFKFDDEWEGQPTEFEATFIHAETHYQYGFSVDQERVWGEWLFAKPNTPGTRTRTLFQREYDSETKEYVWDISKTYVKGEKELWKKSTRDNALFLSTAIHLKATAFKEPFEWVQKYFRIVESPARMSPAYTAHQCIEEGWKNRVLDLVQSVDVRIKEIDVEIGDFDLKDFSSDLLPEAAREKLLKQFSGKKQIKKIQTYHQHKNGKLVPLDFDDESDGSRVVFSIAGPWLDVLDNGYTLVIDELHSSLHPHALKFLVGLFHDPKINTKNAQLIFTSHETSIMSKGFMHQDQVWLVEKSKEESSRLIPLSDYKVRDASAFQKAYLDGRYGAVPKLGDFMNG